MFNTLDISSSGLQAQRIRLDAIAQNVASAHVTRNARGENVPFKRRFPVFTAGRQGNPALPGVSCTIKQDSSTMKKYEPWDADADREGYIKYPNIDTAVEFVNALEASRAYEANVTTMEVTKSMLNATLRILA